MLLWIGLAVMSAIVLAALLRPLMRPAATSPSEAEAATAIYRDQIKEIEAERERGLLATGEAEAARAEIARRLLAAAEGAAAASRAAGGLSDAVLSRIALALAAGLPLVAIVIYMSHGAPQLPGQPLAARLASPAETARIDELIRAVEARLRQHPEDGQGWDVIAPVYMKQGRFREAADAFGRANRLLGESAKRLAGLAESTVLSNDGIVTEPARIAYEKLARLEPGRIEPRFWLAYASEQDGRLEAALAEYRALLKDAPADASWRPLVVERLNAVSERLGVRGEAGARPPARPDGLAAASEPRGLSAEEITAAEQLPPADRQRMIEGMVQGLADRLRRDGGDLAGWERLIRAYSVMGRKADAQAALGDARRNFTGQAQPLARLAELARSLGLDS